jgi:hypothetical protein
VTTTAKVSWRKAIVTVSMKPESETRSLEVSAWVSSEIPGLAVTPNLTALLEPQRGEWVVTHVNSGFHIFGIVLTSVENARKFAEAIADLCDWTMSAATLRGLPLVERERMRAACWEAAAAIEPGRRFDAN